MDASYESLQSPLSPENIQSPQSTTTTCCSSKQEKNLFESALGKFEKALSTMEQSWQIEESPADVSFAQFIVDTLRMLPDEGKDEAKIRIFEAIMDVKKKYT